MFKEFAIAPAYHTAGNFPDPFWRKYIHPSGWLYYRHERDRVLTTVNITDPDEFRTLQRRHRDAGDVFDFPSDGRFTPYLGAFNSDWEITVDHTGYRWIDHAHAFAGEIDQTLTSFLDSVIRFEGKADEALEMRERYWAFLQNVLTWCLADQTLFATSTASFTREQAQQLLDILKSLPEPNTRPVEENMRSYAICLRIWYTSAIARTIAADRMSLRYGQPEARIFRELEKHSEITQFSDPAFNGLGFAIFFAVSFVLFFGIPASCLRQIMDVNRRRFSGGGVNETRWRSFLQSRLKDWSDSNLLATVLIA
ncbi:hypothetical protein SISSUDRAFT_537193 [Sistotremastrum suecicum HHB10207 ss-3]|uniref:WW domain-containing protein n=1 Tax=Sistotremastrum suecicum HHB10207 ss-3 TaxID=1314776 RepID=A0A165XR68_9AGAM|nr:hypothetical protein SISSUDRAFT_537193 [Sistotremastrum suecicum HHB10207 ss-3]